MRFAFLGTSGAVPSRSRDTTSLVFVTDVGSILVDCGGSPVQRLRLTGVDPLAVSHVVITHIHADHAYGLPALVQALMLLRRTAPLAVLCRPEHVETILRLLELFGLLGRSGAFPVTVRGVGLTVGDRAAVVGSVRLSTAPTEHGSMPNFAVRAEPEGAGRAVVYSSDTQPCDTVVMLARGAHTLIHEATFPHRDRGRFGTHSTAREAGEVAARAGVRRLILTHIEADYHDELPSLVDEARKAFGGVVEVARELELYGSV